MDDRKMHLYGKIWTSIVLLMILSMPFCMMIIYRESPNWGAFFACLGLMALYYVPVQIGEVFAYSYMLGTNGTYLAFITGNLSNLKIPCVVNANNIAGTAAGSEEQELVSTMALSVSAITTISVILIGVILITPLTPLLSNEVLTPAFERVVYALFGALGGKYYFKYKKLSGIVFLILTVLCLALSAIPQTRGLVVASYVVFVGVIAGFLVAKKMYGSKKKSAASSDATSDAQPEPAEKHDEE